MRGYRVAQIVAYSLRDSLSAQQLDRITVTVRVLFLFAFRNFRYPYYVFPEVGWAANGT